MREVNFYLPQYNIPQLRQVPGFESFNPSTEVLRPSIKARLQVVTRRPFPFSLGGEAAASAHLLGIKLMATDLEDLITIGVHHAWQAAGLEDEELGLGVCIEEIDRAE